jgi:hypothetical protein
MAGRKRLESTATNGSRITGIITDKVDQGAGEQWSTLTRADFDRLFLRFFRFVLPGQCSGGWLFDLNTKQVTATDKPTCIAYPSMSVGAACGALGQAR